MHCKSAKTCTAKVHTNLCCLIKTTMHKKKHVLHQNKKQIVT
jgi:hypothetical protein